MSVLYKHQEEALVRLRREPRLVLAMDTGTGKTRTILEMCWRRFREWCEVGPVLVLAPVSTIRSTWLVEAENYPDLRVESGQGKKCDREASRESFSRWVGASNSVLVMSYESFRQDAAEWVNIPIGALVLDESTKVKSPHARIGKLVRKLAGRVPRVHCLSGCIAPNGMEDLWAQYFCAEPSRLGPSFIGFRHRYFWQPRPQHCQWLWVMKGADMLRPGGAQAEIEERIKPITFYADKQLCSDLPEQVFEVYHVEPSVEERKLYHAFVKEWVVSVKRGVVVGATALGELMACRIFTAGFAHVRSPDPIDANWESWEEVGESKLRAVGERLEQVPPERGCLVFGQFRAEIERAVRYIQEELGRSAACLYGGTSEKERARVVGLFNEGKLQVIVGHPGAMGHGLNLQRNCSDTIWMSLDYSYEHFKQSCDRVYRNLQTRKVTHHILMAPGTVDEMIWRALESKRSVTAELAAAFAEDCDDGYCEY